jgi:hypothetical protein
VESRDHRTLRGPEHVLVSGAFWAIRELFSVQIDGLFEYSVLEDDEFRAAGRELFPEEHLIKDTHA